MRTSKKRPEDAIYKDIARSFSEQKPLPEFIPGRYPKALCLEDRNINARAFEFMPCAADFPRSIALIGSLGFTVDIGGNEIYRGVSNTAGEVIWIALTEAFGGQAVYLITNSLLFIDALIALKFKPPHPWHIFPDAIPQTLGSLQGNLDFWWYHYWLPYWDSLTEIEKLQYITDFVPTPEWEEFIIFHDR